jgi:hypothetical protein
MASSGALVQTLLYGIVDTSSWLSQSRCAHIGLVREKEPVKARLEDEDASSGQRQIGIVRDRVEFKNDSYREFEENGFGIGIANAS